jgi:hypothetical protein
MHDQLCLDDSNFLSAEGAASAKPSGADLRDLESGT